MSGLSSIFLRIYIVSLSRKHVIHIKKINNAYMDHQISKLIFCSIFSICVTELNSSNYFFRFVSGIAYASRKSLRLAGHVILLKRVRVVDGEEHDKGSDCGSDLGPSAVPEECRVRPLPAPTRNRDADEGKEAAIHDPGNHLKEKNVNILLHLLK